MEIILQGKHNSQEALESLQGVIQLFKERYHITQFREIHLTITLVDEKGQDVELVDSETDQAYRTFEVYREGLEFTRPRGVPVLKLIVDNTHK